MIFSVGVVYPQELTLQSGTDRGVHFKGLPSVPEWASTDGPQPSPLNPFPPRGGWHARVTGEETYSRTASTYTSVVSALRMCVVTGRLPGPWPPNDSNVRPFRAK